MSVKLDLSGNYLFGYYLYGVIGVGVLLTFVIEATGFYEVFSGFDLRFFTLFMNFKFLFICEVLMGFGINSVIKLSVEMNLMCVLGVFVVIVIGGVFEALDARSGWVTFTFVRRKGFVKMVFCIGVLFVFVFVFGENDIFE